MGLNAIGRGTLTIQDSALYGHALVNFRRDYGSTWEGDLVIRNCRWVPACGDTCWPHMINVSNDGMHDFGYPCSMPRKVTIDGLFVDDTHHPEDYQGMYLFSDADDMHVDVQDITPTAKRPFLYAPCQKVPVRGLTTASGKKPRLLPSEKAGAGTVVIVED